MRIPTATYRLQLGPSFHFADAKAVIPYLAQLGISDVYASPILTARRGSTHGYDLTNPDELNPALGTREDFEALAAERQSHRMGWVQDIVPNHMAYSGENHMLMDVFEHGSRSPFHGFFDIFHDHGDLHLRTSVLAPFLGAPLEETLQKGEIYLALDEAGLALRYYDWRFPLYLPSYRNVLQRSLHTLGQDTGAGDPKVQQLKQLGETFARAGATNDRGAARERLAQAKRTLLRLYRESAVIGRHLDGAVAWLNRPFDGPLSQSPLGTLLAQQFFKPVFWQTAQREINYRRFFYLNDYISLCVEKPEVFDRTHEHIFKLAREGFLTGLRIDHVDGLYDPAQYLRRLRDELPTTYLVVEKILGPNEPLVANWPIQGTSGYDFCRHVNGVFCDRENEAALTHIYHDFIDGEFDYADLAYNEKRRVLAEHMAGEIAYLSHLSLDLSQETEPPARQQTQDALTAIIAAFPVYRTYVDDQGCTQQDKACFAQATEEAKMRAPDCAAEIDRIGALLHGACQTESNDPTSQACRRFIMRFQQFTAPAMAKGFEDTMLYNYNRFVSLNEVGGEVGSLGVGLDEFHAFHRARARDWPQAMNATSTHDTKRGEDVRARLNVLSEMPSRWRDAVMRWKQINEPHKRNLDDGPAPDPNDEYLLYQTLVGALPFEPDRYRSFTNRLREYLVKAVREAKRHSTWARPNMAYEDACRQFIDRITEPAPDNRFRQEFFPFAAEIGEYGICNSLSQTLLKMTCPGLPDFYQGTELWDLNLVDPDNRRPVDFDKRARFLREMQEPLARAQLIDTLIESRQDGRIKLFLIQQVLRARRENELVFKSGTYVPAGVTGRRSRHVVAFFRVHEGEHALVVAPRFFTSLAAPGEFAVGSQVWADTRIHLPPQAPARWHDAITEGTLDAQDVLFVGDILSVFPVALLLGTSG